jgi:hypothetical protein
MRGQLAIDGISPLPEGQRRGRSHPGRFDGCLKEACRASVERTRDAPSPDVLMHFDIAALHAESTSAEYGPSDHSASDTHRDTTPQMAALCGHDDGIALARPHAMIEVSVARNGHSMEHERVAQQSRPYFNSGYWSQGNRFPRVRSGPASRLRIAAASVARSEQRSVDERSDHLRLSHVRLPAARIGHILI